MIVELRYSLLSAEFQDVTSVVFHALSAAKTSASNIHDHSSTFRGLIAVYIPPMLTIGILLLNH